MDFSLSLLRHRLAARRQRAAPDLPAHRAEGRLLWAHFGHGLDTTGARLVLEEISREAPDLAILTTGTTEETDAPADTIAAASTFLEAWRPDIAVFFGSDPCPAVWTEGLRRGVPLFAAETDTARLSLPLIRPMKRFDAVIAARPDPRLEPIIEPLGPLSTVPAPPPTTDRFAPLRQAIGTRQVWLALDLPFAELDLVLSVHERVAQLSHRLLLILAPLESERAGQRLSEIDWRFATRSAGQEPKAEDRILLVDDPDERGDWMRLAPVTYLGGTISGNGPRTSPMAAASLGSALVHGPFSGRFEFEIACLREAGAACVVADMAGLAAELERLQSPDTAAERARAGWTVTSANAEASARLVELIGDTLAGIDF